MISNKLTSTKSSIQYELIWDLEKKQKPWTLTSNILQNNYSDKMNAVESWKRQEP